MSLRSSGTCCAVRGCTNNQRKLNIWLQQQCFEHAPETKRSCSCEQRYSFHRLPIDEEPKRMWLRNLSLKTPPKSLYVCSFHFVDKKPTEENPYPTLWLGYDKPPEKRRRVLKRTVSRAKRASGELGEMDRDEVLCSTSEPSCDAQTQLSGPDVEDHSYSKGPTTICTMTTLLLELPRPVANSILQSDADSLLYTGIPLVEFHTLVSCLQPFAPTSTSVPLVDQILITLMKLRQNFAMADIAQRLKTSQVQVSEIVGLWINIMSEH